MIKISDLREWLKLVEEMGELRRVEGADWDLEIGGITEVNNKNKRAPALLFDRIKGYPPGYRIVTGTTGTPGRLGATLRLSTIFSNQELVQALRGKSQEWEARQRDYAPEVVATGPVKENVHFGKDVNLLEFPVPKWHEADGGRYIGTGDVVITKDLDSDWINLGSYRIMVHDEQHAALHIIPGKHGRQQLEKYFAQGKPFPVVISIGHDPLLFLFAGLEVPYGISEYNYVGAIIGEGVKVIKGEVTGLPIPATSEIVLEGWCRPGNLKEEGPFGEFTGYYTASEAPVPVIDVECIMHRNDPIILGSPPCRPPHDFSYSKTVMRSALLHDALEKAGVPGVKACWADEVGGARQLLIVSIQQRYQGHARQAGFVASQCHVGAYLGRYVIVVDEDIDPTNLQDVMWAVVTRADPERDIDVIRRAWGSKADPLNRSLNARVPFNSRAIIDACRPYDYLAEFPPVAEASPEFLKAIREKWETLFAEEQGLPMVPTKERGIHP